MTRPRRQPIPLTIVCGPRGAGKTRLINRLLRDPAFANTAVILNEFGATGLENALVERAEQGIIALGGGCICCAVRGELIDALERLLRDLDNGRVAEIARVVIESEASADPAAILAAVARHPYLSLRFRPDGIVAVIGAAQLPTIAGTRDTLRQVAMADAIAVSGGEAERARLAGINPFAAMLDPQTAPPRAFIGVGAFAGEVPTAALGSAPGIAGVNACSVVREREIPLSALDRFLDFLAALHGQNLIRVRGIVATEEGSVLVAGVGGFFWPPRMVGRQGAHTRFDMVASPPLDRQGFESYLDAFLNEPQIDTPDRQALTENPLAIAGFSARSVR
ncbi:GTP-binding protein [soil metagenome]